MKQLKAPKVLADLVDWKLVKKGNFLKIYIWFPTKISIISIVFFGLPSFWNTALGVTGHDETHWPKCLELNHKCRCVKCPGHLWTQDTIGVLWNWWSVHLGSRRYQDEKCVLWCDMGILYLFEIVWVVVPNAASSSRRAMKLSHKLRGCVWVAHWRESGHCGQKMKEPTKQMHFKDVIWFVTVKSLQCWNMLNLRQ